MSDRRALVVASWGLPSRWNEGEYIRPKMPPGECPRPSEVSYVENGVKSRTSLSAVIEAVEEAGYEADVVIIGLDTLAFPGGLNGLIDEARKALEELYAKVRKGEVNYGDVREAARAVLSAYAKKYLGRAEVEVEVVPGSGVYRAGEDVEVRFISDLRNAETAMLAALYKRLYKKENYDAVFVDMTHGVNYLAATLYKVSEAIAAYIRALRQRRVCYAVFNSDPVYKDGDSSRINIVKLENISEEPSLFISKVAEKLEKRLYVMAKLVSTEQPIEDLDKQYTNLLEKASLRNIAQALAYGFGLYIFQKAKDLAGTAAGAYQLVEKVLDAIYNTVRTSTDAGQKRLVVTIERTYGIDPSPVYLAMALDVLVEKFGNLQTDEEGGVYLKQLKQLPLHKLARKLLTYEIEDISNRVEILKRVTPEGVYLDYNSIYELANMPAVQLMRKKEEEPKLRKAVRECDVDEQNCGKRNVDKQNLEKCDANERNYIAHAGLERTAICVKIQGDKIYVKYKEKCREAVEQILARGSP